MNHCPYVFGQCQFVVTDVMPLADVFLFLLSNKKADLRVSPRMAAKRVVRPDEGLMMMQELDDRLKEQIDKLEHIRLAAVELKDNLSGV